MASEKMWKVPFYDLSVSDAADRDGIFAAISNVSEHGQFILGPEVAELENVLAERCGRGYAVGVNSGTTALMLSLRALSIGTGDEVITTALSWIATPNAILLAEATPVFADVGDDVNIAPESAEQLISSKTKAILPVHYGGKICDMEALRVLADAHNVPIIEDAAQAFGAVRAGRPAGSFGDISIFSMNATKVFGAWGEAGMILTDDEGIANRIRRLRNHGLGSENICVDLGVNGRLETVQAAVLLAKLDGVNEAIDRRRQIASAYATAIGDAAGVPSEAPDAQDSWYSYNVRCTDRDRVLGQLIDSGVEAKIRDPFPLGDHPVMINASRSGTLTNARKLTGELIAMPIHEKLSDVQVELAGRTLREAIVSPCLQRLDPML